MTLALDISHHTKERSGPLTSQQLDDAWNAGVRTFRPNIGNNANNRNIFFEQIRSLKLHNPAWIVEPYKYYYFGASNAEDKEVIQFVRDNYFPIEWFGVDIEDVNSAAHLTIDQRINETLAIIQQFESFCRTDFYSANWYVVGYLGNTDRLNFMPLWFADWDGSADLVIHPGFGGWQEARMKQYQADLYFASIWCDVNYYEEAKVNPDPIPNPNPPASSHLHQPVQGVFTSSEYDAEGHVRVIRLDIAG